MFREITLGQYYPVDSVIHRLDPRVKLLGTLLFLISLFLVKSYTMYGVAAVFLAILIRLTNVPFKYMVRGLRGILILLLISVSFNLFLDTGHAGTDDRAAQDDTGRYRDRDEDGGPAHYAGHRLDDHDAYHHAK